MLKKIVYIGMFLLVLSSCDDGDIEVSQFNFDTSEIEICNNVLYKISGKEMLLLDLPTDTFKNEVTTPEAPQLLNINATNRILYRLYSINPTTTLFCTTISPSNFVVTDEWQAVQGVDQKTGLIQIVTTAVVNAVTAEITGYKHEIRLLKVEFTNGKSQFVFENYLVGVYFKAIEG